MPRPAPTRAAIYARISLDRSGQAMGVDRQVRECREHAARLGWTLAEPPYDDNDISAKSGKRRPGWERLLADIAAGEVDGVVAVHLDRLLRRVMDVERLLNAIDEAPHQVQVSFVNAGDLDLNTAAGKMLARILATVAANESEQKGERVKSARRAEALAGRIHSTLGYGYNEDRSINPAEAAVIRDVADRVLAGDTMYAIATDLNERGIPTPGASRWTARHIPRETGREDADPHLEAFIDACRSGQALSAGRAARLINGLDATQPDGARWTAAAVRAHDRLALWLLTDRRPAPDGDIAGLLTDLGVPPPRMYWRVANLRAMIRRGALCGWRDYYPDGRGKAARGEMVAEGDWAPILTRETTEAIRQVTDRTVPRPGGRKPRHLLSGIARCGRCDAPLGGHTDKKTGVERYACSQQPGMDRCGGLTIVAPPVDEVVTEALLTAISQVPVGGRRLRRVGGAPAPSTADVAAAETELAEVREARLRYAAEAAAGRLTPDEYAVIRDGLADRQHAAERVLGAYAPPVQVALKGVPRRMPELRQYWESAPLARQRELVALFIDHVTIRPATKGGNRFDYDRVVAPAWRV